MSDAKKPVIEKSFEERKKALIAQGADRRAGVDASIAVIRNNLHADKLAKSAMNHMTAKAYGAVDRLFGRHHVDKVDLSTDLGDDSTAYDSETGVAARFSNLTNGNHATGKFIATVRRFLPLAATALSIMRRRRLIIPVLRGAAVLGGIGAGAYFFYRHRQRTSEMAEDDAVLPYGYPTDASQSGVLDGLGQLH